MFYVDQQPFTEVIVPRLFEEKRRDIVFGIPSFRPSVRPSGRSNETVFMWLRFRILDTYVAICLCVA